MKKINLSKISKTFCVTICLSFSMFLSAAVPAFDNDKPAASYNTEYNQAFTSTWDNTKFYTQWDMVDANSPFNATDISSGYLQFVFPAKRLLCSKSVYSSPYIFQTEIDYAANSNRGGVIIRANPVPYLDVLQAPTTSTTFNREGIAFYPTVDGVNMIVQFTGVENDVQTQATKILVPKPTGLTSFLLTKGTLRIEDFGTSIYVYYNNSPYIRINLSGKIGNIYTSGTVYDSNMQVIGTFTNMEVQESGKLSVTQRDAVIRLHSVLIKSYVAPWIEPQVVSYNSIYSQSFSDVWDNSKFNTQWEALGPFDASDATSGYLQFVWIPKRILRSNKVYTAPYEFSALIDYSTGSSHGGLVIRAQASGSIDDLQDPALGSVFNREGIAFYPTDDGTNMIVQFTGAINGSSTPVTRILVPKPINLESFRVAGGGTIKVVDSETSIYVYYNDAPYIRIDLGDKVGNIYTSGTVYDVNMQVVGTFSGMEVESAGKVAIAQRDAALKLFNVSVKTKVSLWIEPATVAYNAQYKQSFNTTWDAAIFNGQWDTMAAFDANDIAAGYLQFVWVTKRIIRSKSQYVSPYEMSALIDFSAGSSRGGLVIRAQATGDIDDLQVPAEDAPGFNREGIALYPSMDGLSMTVQFTGALNGYSTPVIRIQVPKPEGVSSLRVVNGATIKVIDFGTSIYIYYNGSPYIRIDLGDKIGRIYTSGTVYNSEMQVVGTFTGMEIEAIGKVAIAQRDAALRIYNMTLNYNNLEQQTINFESITKKHITDSPFDINAVTSSGLPIELKIVSGPATLSGSTVTLTGEVGIVTISANQSGNSVYYPALEVVRTFSVSDPTQAVNPLSQDYVDNWVATDGLDRKLPSFDEVGPKRNDKYVGVFYYTWHGFHGQVVNDVTKIINGYPSDPLSGSNPNWGNIGADHFWGEPETGYHRAEDPWVLRRDLQMLSNAHVDFLYIDCTNAFTYIETVKALCNVSVQMRKEGINTPQIAFFTFSRSGQIMNYLYDHFYSLSLYDDLWFNWNGKPLILGDFDDSDLRSEVKNFFTIKYSWAWTDSKNKPNHWQWLDMSPQDYGWSTDPTIPEQISVTVASHPTLSIGDSFHDNIQPTVNNKYVTDFTGQGLYFAQQWKRALEIDPQVIMVTQWNEWIAGRSLWDQGNGTYGGRPIKDGDSYFVDAFTEEFNRDMVPMKGGHTDNYYYQLISNIRKFKGMADPQAFSNPGTINIDGDFSQWTNVAPLFKDPVGDIMHRNYRGFDPTVTYVNNTGRNDIVESRATYDNSNIYFYVKTAQALTPYNDPNWMLLYIDADRNKGTGWEGYDYVVNLGVKSETETTLKKWDGSAWTGEITVPYKLVGNELQLSLPRTALLMENRTPEFYFHWADNSQKLNDISSFFTDGDSAPDRRFNFNFSSSKVEVVPETAFKPNEIPGVIEFEDFDNGGAGVAYADATIGNTGRAYRPTESVDIESKDNGEYDISWTNSGEWLSYTVDIKATGKFTATINYASSSEGKEVILYVDGIDKSGVITLPSSGGLTTWSSKSLDVQLATGKHILKFYIKNASGDIKFDKITFTDKDVVYPGNGTGLNKSIWSATIGGRTWFKDSICSEIDPVINHSWADVSPGCSVSNDFWNIRWQGQIQSLYTETYTFYLTVNDMGRVWINNQLVVDGWNSSSTGTTVTGTIDMVAGQKVPIKVDFAEKTGDAKIILEWSSTSNVKEVVPQSQLYPVVNPNAIRDINMSSFSIYPNPTKDEFTINCDKYNVESIKIVDLQGRIVYNNDTRFIGEKTINISLQKGVYFIKLAGDGSFSTKKLIIE